MDVRWTDSIVYHIFFVWLIGSQLLCCWQGAGTKDSTLIRVIVSRCEVDMVQIKQEFQRQFGTSLDAMIQVSWLLSAWCWVRDSARVFSVNIVLPAKTDLFPFNLVDSVLYSVVSCFPLYVNC